MSLLKKFKKFKKKFSTKPYPVENGIQFIHHNPKRGNVGDLLCSPRHYFSFKKNANPLCIIGGGVFVDYGMRVLKKNNINPNIAILWGVGLSIRQNQELPEKVDTLPYLQWGIRDSKFVANETHFLPCVSCLHPMLDNAPATKKTLLFLNSDPKVTNLVDQHEAKRLANQQGWLLLFNNCNEDDISKAIAQCSHIITNSYHGTYWGLLAGRSIQVIGYSTKFTNLLANFRIEENNVRIIKKGQEKVLINILNDIANHSDKKRIHLTNHQEILNEFRQLNIEFANKMVKNNIINSYSLKNR
jgi:hypothetical protein